MIYELYIEGFKVDIDQKISVQLTYAIDDISSFSSRETGFSKTIVLPGTARNNQVFGFIYDLGSFNYELPGAANIGAIFNVAQTSRAELRLNGLLVLKGVFRITNIIKDKDIIEYEGAIFGELSGFIAQIGNGKLEELDFSDYNHSYTRDNIVNSWDNTDGDGYYYPLIDHGTYSQDKKSYDYRTFRPALFVKEYIDKIFEAGGYTYESTFLNSNFFKRLIIPCNQKEITGLFTELLNATTSNNVPNNASPTQLQTHIVTFNNETLKKSFTGNGNPNYTYTGNATTLNFNFIFNGTIDNYEPLRAKFKVVLKQNGNTIKEYIVPDTRGTNYSFTDNLQISFNTNDTFTFEVISANNLNTTINFSRLHIESANPITTSVQLNDEIIISNVIPKNILQKDFFVWITKMFNLYITEDPLNEKHLIIEPYIDYYGTDAIDWTYKVARDKPWQIKPMGMLNGRFFEYKFKDDNDFYNESYRKKFNQSYGDRLEDTGFQFAKDKQTIEIGFSPSPLIQYNGTDKVVPAIYKKSKGNAVDQEEITESNIRILQAKKITGVNSWNIKNGFRSTDANLGASLTTYGYAGHFDDPVNPTKDINFGAASEIYFAPATYTTNNLFNDYWSEYIAEIADKDSKILSCHVHLTPLDIAQLDFSKPILIDGILFRLNKIEDFDYTTNELVRVELLKIINNG